MPLFIWKGVDGEGIIHKGRSWAASVLELERSLLLKSIAVVQRRTVFVWPLSHSQKRHFFFQVAELLHAHVPLYQSLLIVAATYRSPMRSEIEDIALRVSQGVPFSSALEVHAFTDTLSSALIRMGEKTGSLAAPLKKLVDYWSITSSFAWTARAAVLLPGITFIFFLVIILGLLIGIVPHFELYFIASRSELPWITQLLVMSSRALRAHGFLWAGLLVCCSIALIILKRYTTALFIYIPGIASFARHWWLVRFLQALEILLKSGIPLSDAIEVCQITIGQGTIARELLLCKELVDSGKPLSTALGATLFNSAELESYITIGEASGELGHMIGFAAHTYQQRLFAKMQRWVILINPIFLLVLGGCIAALIVALYMPLLVLSDTLF